MKRRINEILEPQSKSNFLSRSFNIFIISLIVLNVLAVALETMQDLYKYTLDHSGRLNGFPWRCFPFNMDCVSGLAR